VSAITDRPETITDPELDISARSFWERSYDEREQVFARLRAEHPVAFFRPYESTLMPPEDDTPGFWSVVKFEDCRQVSRDAARFSSAEGVIMEDVPVVVMVGAHSFLAMDDPEHRALRGIVQQAFSPRHVQTIDQWIKDEAKELVDEIIAAGGGDFCTQYAKQLPGRIFAHMFGVEKGSEEQETLMDAAEKMLAWDDPEAAQGRDALETHAEEADRIQDVALAVADRRRDDPGEDLMSWVLQAEFEGRQLEDWEIAGFFSLLGSAANDTTRHSIAHGVRLFSENPDQYAYLMEDLDGRIDNAVEEILRHATPVMHFRRTALEDVEIRGQQIRKGDKVVMWYCAGNRDDEVFPEPGAFDISRPDLKHLGFGAGGPHFCMGAALGRMMVKSALVEVFTRMPDIKLAGPVEYQVGNFLHGVHRLPVTWTPPA
jgi:cytochrome P450